MMYVVKQAYNQICNLDQVLQAGNLSALWKAVTEQKHSIYTYGTTYSTAIDETKTVENFIKGFVLYIKSAQNLLSFHACHVINYALNVNLFFITGICFLLEHFKLPVTNVRHSLLDYLNSHPAPVDGLSSGYICKYCIEKFQNGMMPS